jgi:hypothetical protein
MFRRRRSLLFYLPEVAWVPSVTELVDIDGPVSVGFGVGIVVLVTIPVPGVGIVVLVPIPVPGVGIVVLVTIPVPGVGIVVLVTIPVPGVGIVVLVTDPVPGSEAFVSGSDATIGVVVESSKGVLPDTSWPWDKPIITRRTTINH